jgi:hypothetical protein
MLEGREIGTVHFVPDPGSVLAVGGKRWEVKSVDGRRREIWVGETNDAGGERLWRGGRGGGIHRRIAETARRILAETDTAAYPYLSPAARDALDKSRRIAAALGITEGPLAGETGGGEAGGPEQGGGEKRKRTIFLFPWTGSAGIRTIAAILGTGENKRALKITGLEEEADLYFRITTGHAPPDFRTALTKVCRTTAESFRPGGEGSKFVRRDAIPYTDKYDYLLPPGLLSKQYAANMLDGTAAERLLAALSGGPDSLSTDEK